ncbi:MAG: adenylyl-sulfate kinase [Draconibacterium sp.]|nr:adenylyl-sulfate kinase [Draconibacterium sp.]
MESIKNNGRINPGTIVWLFGRPCSGKTTIGIHLKNELENTGIETIIFDGDELRKGINKDLKFSIKDREENIRRTAEIAKMLAQKGYWVVCSLITPLIGFRQLIQQIVGEIPLNLIFVNTPLEECIKRDKKGHYKKAADGRISNFTGVSSPFEEPLSDKNSVATIGVDIRDSVQMCLKIIQSKK